MYTYISTKYYEGKSLVHEILFMAQTEAIETEKV